MIDDASNDNDEGAIGEGEINVVAVRKVRAPGEGPGRRIGYVRVLTDGSVQFRPAGQIPGAHSAPPWGPVPEHVRILLDADIYMTNWLARWRAQVGWFQE